MGWRRDLKEPISFKDNRRIASPKVKKVFLKHSLEKEHPMRKLSITIIALLLVAAIHTPVNADQDHKGRMTAQHFEISSVYGYREFYNPGEEIAFYVEGKSPVEIEAEPNSGFRVQASITNETRNKTIAEVDGNYDEGKRAWLVTFTAPSDPATSYKINIYFYCATEGAPCDGLYGRAARAIKILPLQIH